MVYNRPYSSTRLANGNTLDRFPPADFGHEPIIFDAMQACSHLGGGFGAVSVDAGHFSSELGLANERVASAGI